MMQLYEQYRPRTWSDVLGQPKIMRQLETLKTRGLGGRAYWLTGQSGTGKTTIARIIAHELASDLCTVEIDATDLTPAALREIERSMGMYGLGDKNGRAYILNEAHGLRRDTVRQLLVLLERLPSHVCWIFTTTNEGQDALFDGTDDAHPLLSRCIVLPLARRNITEAFARRAREIATTEGLNGRPHEAYVRLVQKHRNNMRAVLQAIEAGEMQEN